MPYATNPSDRVRTYFEDGGGGGQPVLVYPGFTDPLGYAKASPLAQALGEDFRLIFADHRGQGSSDKPHDVASYALTTRVADAVAILDALGIERAHYLGFSLGARPGFAIGEQAPERVLSLALCGNQPYAWPVDGPMLRAVADAVAAGREHGMVAFVEKWESSIGERFPAGRPMPRTPGATPADPHQDGSGPPGGPSPTENAERAATRDPWRHVRLAPRAHAFLR